MAQPTFLTDIAPSPHDTPWYALVKQLSAFQNTGPAIPANNPRRSDTTEILQQKLAYARTQNSYPGN